MKKKKPRIPHYLKKAGFPRCCLSAGFMPVKEKKEKKYNAQVKKYGFDERRTWNVERSMYEWLYETVCMYIDFAPSSDKPAYIFSTKTLPECLSQKRALLMIKEELQECITDGRSMKKEIWMLLYDMLPDIWW